MATTQDTTAPTIDRQAQPDADHDWKTCQDHADCVTRGKRWAQKQAMRANGQAYKENDQYAKDVADMIRTHALRIGFGGNVEDLTQLTDLHAVVEEALDAAVAVLREQNPGRRDGAGASWDRVGAVLGMRKQSAWERFKGATWKATAARWNEGRGPKAKSWDDRYAEFASRGEVVDTLEGEA